MAVIEQEVKQEVVREIRIPISREQEEALTRAASQTGQSLEEFAASALSRAAEESVSHELLHSIPKDIASAAEESFARDVQWHQSMQGDQANRFDKIFGIFKDEPLMEALMERIREDRRVEIERFAREADAEG